MLTLHTLKCFMHIEDRILAELQQRKPASLLAEGAVAQALAHVHFASHADCVLVAPADAADMAIAFLDAIGGKAQVFALIGLLKQKAPAVLIAVNDGAPMGFNDYLSLGMQRLAEADERGRSLYLFDLHTYKPAPDWLNAKYWAHPELWKP
jgi:hypothetical protein